MDDDSPYFFSFGFLFHNSHLIFMYSSIPQLLVCRQFSNSIQSTVSQSSPVNSHAPPHKVWHAKLHFRFFVNSCLAHPIWTISLSSACVQFDFVKLLDGKALPRSLTEPVLTAKAPKGLLLSGLQETGFIEYMDPGTWHLALYNDGRNLEQVLLHSTPIGEENNVVAFSSLFSKNVLCAYFIVCFPHST